MSAQTDELKNIVASLTNIIATLEAAEANVPVAPEVPTPEPVAPVEDGTLADNTPSAQPEVPSVPES